MTSKCFKNIMQALGYCGNSSNSGKLNITETWIRLSNIARINLTTNNSLYREEHSDLTAYYYYDEDLNLLFKAAVNPDGSVIGVTMILDVSQITSIETRNAMSASMFSGNSQ